MIDLHLHTTASDGTCTPEDLVHRAWKVGLRTISVTDHDTMAAVAPATAAAGPLGVTVIPGIEITSVHEGRDVHVLAYFLSEAAPGLQELLAQQRRARVERAHEIARRLAAVGAPIDLQPLLDSGSGTAPRSLARAGHCPRPGRCRSCDLDCRRVRQVPSAKGNPGTFLTRVRRRQRSPLSWPVPAALRHWRIPSNGEETI
jgi:hypothetical protein